MKLLLQHAYGSYSFWYTLKNQLVADNSQGAQDQEMKALKTFRRAIDVNAPSHFYTTEETGAY